MQIHCFLWIALYLAVDTSTKSVRCTYNETGEHGSPLKSLHQVEEACESDRPCENGAVCETDKGGNFCKCLPGTEGNFCGNIVECDELNCTSADAECVYSVVEEKAICSCKNSNIKYDYVERICREACDSDRLCENGAVCETNKVGNFCRCLSGTEGNFCENIVECDELNCTSADAECIYSVVEKKGMCSCKNTDLKYDYVERTCRDCDCGNNSLSCEYESGKKLCICYSGYEENNGKCEICDCGNNSLSCEYESGKKVCICYPGYEENNGKCEICYCGENSLSCKYENGEKVCDCHYGYAEKDGKCEICDCGENSYAHLCKYENGEKVCGCWPAYVQKNGKCEICYCGENSWSCKYENGEKVCDCYSGYVEKNGKCEKIPFASTLPPTEITPNATRNSSAGHSSDFTTLNRSSVAVTTTVRPTGADPCIENPCQNGGTCVFLDNRSKCLCRKPYLGILCETDPCDLNPCMHEGVCKIKNEAVKCYCKKPFAGKFCESIIKIDAYVVTLVAASVLSAIVLMFVTCVMCRRYRVTRTS